MVGGALFLLAYLSTTIISFRSARFSRANAAQFSRSAYALLSTANDEDYVAIFRDVQRNIASIAKLAAFNENYRWAGLDHKEPSAFYDFIHRHTIERSYFAGTLLRLLSDARCCRAIILGDSITVLECLRTVKAEQLHCDALSSLIQALARQAIIQDDSMLAREVGYTGFAVVRSFLDGMFGDPFLARTHEPLRGVEFTFDLELTVPLSDRLAAAVERTWRAVGDVWQPSSLWVASRVLEGAISNTRREEQRNPDQRLRYGRLYDAVEKICKISDERILQHAKLKHAASLYADEAKPDHHNNVAGVTADLAVDTLMALSNDFAGSEDVHWSDALSIMGVLFDPIGEQPDGLTPVQQRALMLICKKLRDNMRGYYPALTRLLLAVIGPYKSHHQKNHTAFRILEDAAYGIWKDFARLKEEHPEKIGHYLPPNVVYDAEGDTLVHTYRGGEQRVTHLKSLELPAVDPLDPAIHRVN
jgi:hypothetical protein